MINVQSALDLILMHSEKANQTLQKSLIDSKYYILAKEVVADRDYPPFPRATMDGYAVRENDLLTSNEFNLIGEIFAGESWNHETNIEKNSCVKIMTGAPVPEVFDTIIKIEDTSTTGNKVKIKTEKFFKGLNIAKQGEDAKKGNVIANVGDLVDDSILTIAASFGYSQLELLAPPKVSIISTGNEVVNEKENPLPHQIRDSNSITIRAMLKAFQIDPIRIWNLPDDSEILLEKLSQCFDSDICIITGGVSAGDADYIPHVLKKLGVSEIFHKVSIRPGKPIWFGKKEKTLFFGLPGNPISTRVTFKVFVEPCIRKFLHLGQVTPLFLPLKKARKKKHDLEEYFRVKIISENNRSYLEEKPNNGSGDFIGSLHTSGIAKHLADYKELPENTFVQFFPW